MKIEFQLTLADYKAALKLHRRQKLTRRLLPWIWPTLLLVCAVSFVVSSAFQNLELVAQSFALGAGALVGTIGLPIARWINTHRCYNRMFPPTRTSRTTIIEIEENRIVEINPGAEEIRVGWSGILEFLQDEKITMMYIGVARFFLFPTPSLSAEQSAELNGLVARHVTKNKR